MFLRVLPLALALLALAPAVRADEPAHEVVRRIGDLEIRRYAPFIVAEIEWPGPPARARAQAPDILHDYAAGDNELRRKVASIPPVIVARAPSSKDYWGRERATQQAADRPFIVQMVVGAGADASSLPVPTDARVRLQVQPAALMAVLRFKGEASDREVETQVRRLTDLLDQARLNWVGEPIVSTYDRPMVPAFMRRNEVWLRLRPGRDP